MDYNSGIGHARRQGIKEGIRENQLEVAKKMKEKKIDIHTIVEVTGLTEDEINAIK